ncbi:adenylate/guanylate cyclase domain-containing protein [Phaeobacter sp. HF9A]|uniref:adenylate/guanylate cyclase domain-containing protein n=1 Tax=Phaeobacter sp. HF9A TaxID=2721561 RepID=UPI0014302423|nr:adenylate/guanylate cyclase domain-containing protein [Phaeobacter sp. HF9A]NIZ14188.1 adenylate/guanylate cyclase domain-containing protein [Phaeobacter sp. HF9A]
MTQPGARHRAGTRVRPDAALLRIAELRAEKVVSVLRILLALGLMIVFFLAVGDPPKDLAGFLHRQWTFAVLSMVSYLLLGVFSLWLVRSGRFRRWMIWPVVTLDCLFMLVNTWVGLENVAMPGGLTFLLPSTWLVPLVLAFAVLRFNPYLQIYCVALTVGGLAALSFMVDIALPEDIAARVSYLVAVPPNVVRLTMILLAGVVLVVAAAAMRSLLHRSLIETKTRLSLTRYLPARLAERLEGEDLATIRQGQRQDMAVMFVDIRAFTAWSEGRDPAEVGAFVTEFRIRVQDAAQATGGLVDKFIGDAAMLLFEGDGAARRGLRCAELLSAAIGDWSEARRAEGREEVRVGIGLHWGEVFSGVVGGEDRLEYTALGDTVNIAARLEELTKVRGMEVIASAAMLEAAGESVPEAAQSEGREPAREGWMALQPEPLRGRHQPVALFGRPRAASAR